jgi:hypothetical protein
MRAQTLALLTLTTLTMTAATACSRSTCSGTLAADRSAPDRGEPPKNAGAATPPQASTTDASRIVSEADVVQLDQEQLRIYAMSRSGTLAIVDAATPGKLGLMGKVSLPGEPFEMYRRGDVLLAMSNHGVRSDGNVADPLPESATPPPADAKSSAVLSAVDVHDPANARALTTFKVAGEIADSRIVGAVLYLVTYENGECWSCAQQKPRTLVTTFDVSDPTAPKQIDQIGYESPNGATFNAAWATPWKRSVIATDTRLYVGGLASAQDTTTDEGVIEVLDITDPKGHLVRGAKITTAGPIMSRWQMDESNGHLRVVSQRGAGRTSNGEKFPDIDTFRIESTSSIVRVGHTTMRLPRQEGLKTVRFDGARGYAITFNQTDPLFTIDLSDPAHPQQKGELQMPGWMFHLEPRGDRLIGLGLDRTDPQGSLNVSLFDVGDMAAPRLVKRVSFGPHVSEDYEITQAVLAEDQDRIQKAFRIYQDGLVAIPFSGGGLFSGDACKAQESGVQLVDWTRDGLTKRALIPMAGNPRRTVRRDSDQMKEIIAISDSNVSAFAIDERDAPRPTADVVIGTCVPKTMPRGMGGGDFNEGRGYGGRDYVENDSAGMCF